MRVLSVLHYPVFGGPAAWTARTAPALANLGVEITALAPSEPGNLVERLNAAGVETRTIPLRRLRATKNPLTHAGFLKDLTRDISGIRRTIRDIKADIVQVNGMENPHGAVAGRLEGAGVIGRIEGPGNPAPLRLAMGAWTRALVDVALITGEQFVSLYPGLKSMGARLLSFTPPIDTEHHAPGAERGKEAKAELGLAPGVPLIGTVGNINPHKGYANFIQAVDLVLREMPEARAVIVGEVPPSHTGLFERLKERLDRLGLSFGEHVRLVRGCSDTAKYLSAIDVYVQASVAEGISTTLLEAMAVGRPVVATDVGSTSEVVEDGVNGFLVPANSPDAIARRVVSLLNDRDKRDAMGRRGREVVLGRATIDHSADIHLKAYQEAVERASARRSSRPDR